MSQPSWRPTTSRGLSNGSGGPPPHGTSWPSMRRDPPRQGRSPEFPFMLCDAYLGGKFGQLSLAVLRWMLSPMLPALPSVPQGRSALLGCLGIAAHFGRLSIPLEHLPVDQLPFVTGCTLVTV